MVCVELTWCQTRAGQVLHVFSYFIFTTIPTSHGQILLSLPFSAEIQWGEGGHACPRVSKEGTHDFRWAFWVGWVNICDMKQCLKYSKYYINVIKYYYDPLIWDSLLILSLLLTELEFTLRSTSTSKGTNRPWDLELLSCQSWPDPGAEKLLYPTS